MRQSRVKLIVGGVIVSAAVAFLAFAGVRDGWVYYVPVDQFVADQSIQHSRVRLHGRVGEENFEASPATLSAKFDLLGDESKIRVNYTGVIPDLFKVDRDVVVEGRLDESSGVFKADVLLTKCASKYEAKDAPHSTAEGASN